MAWKLLQSPRVDDLFVAPGNGGTGRIATNIPLRVVDIPQLLQRVRDEGIALSLVGPEAALATGIVDEFSAAGLSILGPSKSAAEIESSKAFAKEFMGRHDIPCAESMVFDSYQEARRFLEHRSPPIVVKADGLAAGKGVTVAGSLAQAVAALEGCMREGVFGDAGKRVVIEEFMEGRELSVFAFTDGVSLSTLVAACDYKRVCDGDRGPNTGGMGAYSPPEFWSTELETEALQRIFLPTVQGLADEGRIYRGVLYGGLMLTTQGLKVVEFNARLGDPEAQVILPRLETDLVDIAEATVAGELSSVPVHWNDQACVGVVMASGGYPDSFTTGHRVYGIDAPNEKTLIFHAGTEAGGDGEIITSGGRVLTVVGRGPGLAEARGRAYETATGVQFGNAYYRRDIAERALIWL